MRIIVIPILTLALFLTPACQRQEDDPSQMSLIRPNSPRAEMLALSHEDISMLASHNPEVLRKIGRREPLSIPDVISMQDLGLSPETMILVIEHTSSLFTLSTSDVIRLQTEGVPFKVINYMIRT